MTMQITNEQAIIFLQALAAATGEEMAEEPGDISPADMEMTKHAARLVVEAMGLGSALEAAFGVIMNAYAGNWHEASPMWRAAAERWRDRYLGRVDGTWFLPAPEDAEREAKAHRMSATNEAIRIMQAEGVDERVVDRVRSEVL